MSDLSDDKKDFEDEQDFDYINEPMSGCYDDYGHVNSELDDRVEDLDSELTLLRRRIKDVENNFEDLERNLERDFQDKLDDIENKLSQKIKSIRRKNRDLSPSRTGNKQHKNPNPSVVKIQQYEQLDQKQINNLQTKVINIEKMFHIRNKELKCDRCPRLLTLDTMYFVNCCVKHICCEKCVEHFFKKIGSCQVCTNSCQCYQCLSCELL